MKLDMLVIGLEENAVSMDELEQRKKCFEVCGGPCQDYLVYVYEYKKHQHEPNILFAPIITEYGVS